MFGLKNGLLLLDRDSVSRNCLAGAFSGYFTVYQVDSLASAIEVWRGLEFKPQTVLLNALGQSELESYIDALLDLSDAINLFVTTPLSRGDAAYWRVKFISGAPHQLCQQLLRLQSGLNESSFVQTLGMIGRSPALQQLRSTVRTFAQLPFHVLIEGESGCGKELVANAIYQLQKSHYRHYQAINCAAIAPNLMESTLFGHVKGAFTGANSTQVGLFDSVGAGVLFLDEIGELSLDMQAKLLRVLENGEFQRLGETKTRQSQARIIAATNRNLAHEVRQGRFRADLYHRLKILTIKMPTLREMEQDKCCLLEHFSAVYAAQIQCEPFVLSDEAMFFWCNYDFPGNVRELRNLVIRLTSKYAQQVVSLAELQAELEPEVEREKTESFDEVVRRKLRGGQFYLDQYLREQESHCIHTALNMVAGNMSAAAKMLGIKRTTLYSRLAV